MVQITSAVGGRECLSLPQSRACGVYTPRVAMATAMAKTVVHTVPSAIEYDTGACRACCRLERGSGILRSPSGAACTERAESKKFAARL